MSEFNPESVTHDAFCCPNSVIACCHCEARLCFKHLEAIAIGIDPILYACDERCADLYFGITNNDCVSWEYISAPNFILDNCVSYPDDT